MVHFLEEVGGMSNPRLLKSMATVPRHKFIPARYHPRAYHHIALPIGEQQIILPPIIAATMLEALALTGTEQILEVGTGSGYLTALLEQLGHYVFSLERSPRLAEAAAARLYRLGYEQLDVHLGDGSQGLPDMAPFHAIIATSAVPRLPRPLAAQMYPDGGRMVIPIGDKKSQILQLIIRHGDQWQSRTLRSIQTTALIGRFGFKPDSPPSVEV
ncbi:MAG: protein-L-isoaspartate O-methyltransferase [Anaerolineae bacterium]|nr:protein-L-isoaspartate O-methyltransferase [Anaerolineae bacterium]